MFVERFKLSLNLVKEITREDRGKGSTPESNINPVLLVNTLGKKWYLSSIFCSNLEVDLATLQHNVPVILINSNNMKVTLPTGLSADVNLLMLDSFKVRTSSVHSSKWRFNYNPTSWERVIHFDNILTKSLIELNYMNTSLHTVGKLITKWKWEILLMDGQGTEATQNTIRILDCLKRLRFERIGYMLGSYKDSANLILSDTLLFNYMEEFDG